MLKDATPYNVQWRGSQPVFIDVGSFERAQPGEPWAAYRQFCMLYLYPLLLEAYRGVAFQPWLRGSIDGISPRDARALFTRRDALRQESCVTSSSTPASSGGTPIVATRCGTTSKPRGSTAGSWRRT